MTLTDSILTTIKEQLGIVEDYEHFDEQIVMIINSIFSTLEQLGVDKPGFFITDATTTWHDYIGDSPTLLGLVKPYIYTKTRLLFDPPTSGSLMESMNKISAELEWRINVLVDPKKEDSGEEAIK